MSSYNDWSGRSEAELPPRTEGFIKLHRKLKASPIYNAPPKARLLFIEFLLRASYKEDDYELLGTKKVYLEDGQLLASYSEMAGWIECSKSTVKRYLELFSDETMIETQRRTQGKYQKTLVTVLNWGKYQESNQSDETSNATSNANRNAESNALSNAESNDNSTKELKKERIKEVYEFWVDSKAGVQHRSLKEPHRKAVNARLEDGFSVDELKKAIENLAVARNSDKYYWSHKWTLKEFMSRQQGAKVEQFLEGIDEFRKDENDEKNKLQDEWEEAV